jgi:tetratricopeptide (TPR) repeat protein
MPGEFRSDPLLVQLAELHRSRKSGRLAVTRGPRRLEVDLGQGQVLGVESEIAAGGEAAESELVLLDGLDLAADPGIFRAVAREKLLEALAWTDATCVFTEGEPEESDPPLQLSTEEVLGEAIARIRDPALIRAALGSPDRILALAFDPLNPKNLTLTPTEGYILSRIDGTLSAREVIQLIPLDPDETERSLFSLLLSGLVEYLSLPGRPAVPAPDLAPPLELDLGIGKEPAHSSGDHSTPAPTPTPSPATPSPAVRPSSALPAATRAELEATRREVDEAFGSKVGNRNHFEVLELGREADVAAVKAAYFRLAKRFHPDAHLDPELNELKDKLKAVFVRLGAAYEVLGNPRRRADYESSLPRRSFNPPKASAPTIVTPAGTRPLRPGEPPPEAAPPPTEEDRAQRSEDGVARAEAFLAEEKWWDAIQALERALGGLTGRRLQYARLLLAKVYTRNPNWLKRGEEMAKTVVRDDPKNVDAHYFLATLYRTGGLQSRATAMFRKVLELSPDHKEAMEALGESAPKPAPTPLLKRFFRKS